MSERFEMILNRLEALRWNSEKQSGTAHCPAHDDRSPSLAVRIKNGRLLAKCFAGCTWGEIVAATETQEKDWFEESLDTVAKANAGQLLPKPKVVARFVYHDEGGNVVYEKLRIEPGKNGRRKDFTFRRRQSGGGGWAYGFEGVKPVLYRLPELIDPRFKNHPLFIVEGEAKVDALHGLGFRATCAPFGAGRWLENFGPRFVGRRCVILPDNDDPGIRYSQLVAAHLLHWEAAEIRVVHLAGLPDKGDVIDFLRFTAGGPAAQKAAIIRAVKAAKNWRLFDGEPEADHRAEFARVDSEPGT